MIQAQELRIGNLVNRNGELFAIEILHIANTMIGFEPIELTPNWLLRFGGVENELVPFYEIDMPRNIGYISINPSNHIIWLKHRRTDSALNPGSMLYVHQLQNLYFALTGEELKYTT